MFINIIGMFLNEHFPVWYPTVELLLFFVFAAALVLIGTWWCKDTRATRTNLRIAAYLIFGSIGFSIIVALVYVVAACETNYVMVGTGDKDDAENYDKVPKTWYLLGYIFFGLVIIVLTLGFLWTLEQYKDQKKDAESGSEDGDKSSQKSDAK